ncbi:hypothetical protein D8I24_0396 (plasmid) [Cupriavidus necator H850]|nr:hypothetical protein D8I24_0396 [Cupriavidus necator H850]
MRELDQERTARQKQRIASARSVFTVIAVVTAIQAQMADYGLTGRPEFVKFSPNIV